MDEIEAIRKEETNQEQRKTQKIEDPEGNGLKTGINFEPTFIVAPVVEESGNGKKYILTHAQVTANCQLNPFIALGIGAGIRSYSFEDTYIPFYGQFRVNFRNKPISPYLETALGYGFSTTSDTDTGGAIFNLSFGFAKKFKHTGQVRFGLVLDAFDRDNTYDLDGYYSSLGSAAFGLKVGFTF